MAVAGGRPDAGDGWHAEREGELAGGDEDREGCAHLPLREVAASDSVHPLRWSSILRNQRRTLSFPFPNAAHQRARPIWRPLEFRSLMQLYFYIFDIFRESGVPEDQMSYLSIGVGATELIAVSLSVSTFLEHLVNQKMLFSAYIFCKIFL